MKAPRNTPRLASLAGLAAFGIASLGAVSMAAAHPAPPQAPGPHDSEDGTSGSIGDGFGSDWADDDRQVDDDLEGDVSGIGTFEHIQIDFQHYDTDRDGVLGPTERNAYWSHMVDMGVFGQSFTPAEKARLARLVFLFDRDGDGRLTEGERHAVARLIRARQVFVSLDQNRDNNVSRREAHLMTLERRGHYPTTDRYTPYSWNFFSWNRSYRPDRFRPTNWIAARFQILDSNDNGRVSWGEVESHLIRAFRRGDRP